MKCLEVTGSGKYLNVNRISAQHNVLGAKCLGIKCKDESVLDEML
jgi:hypothetical protein